HDPDRWVFENKAGASAMGAEQLERAERPSKSGANDTWSELASQQCQNQNEPRSMSGKGSSADTAAGLLPSLELLRTDKADRTNQANLLSLDGFAPEGDAKLPGRVCVDAKSNAAELKISIEHNIDQGEQIAVAEPIDHLFAPEQTTTDTNAAE